MSRCLSFKNENRKESLIPHEVPFRAWSKVGTDTFHFNGMRYLLVIDYFSKYFEMIQLTNATSEVIVDNLKSIFSRLGIPDIVMSDNGPEYSSHTFKTFAQTWNFKHITSSPLYPQSNGQAERTVQIAKNILKKSLFENTDYKLAYLEYLNTPISNTIASPAELLHNRKLRSVIPYTPKMLTPKLQKDVRPKILDRQAKQKLYYDKGSRDLQILKVGQKVKVKVSGKWVNATVIAIVGIRSYSVQLDKGGILVRNRRHLIIDCPSRPESLDPHYPSYDDITTPSDSATCSTSPPRQNNPPAPRAASPAPVSLPTLANTQPYVTRFGRTVRPPNRWGYDH